MGCSRPAAASVSPSGLNATESDATGKRTPVGARRRTSHSRTFPPRYAVTSSFARPSSPTASSSPSGEKASAWEVVRNPLSSGPADRSVRASHSVTCPPSPETASRRPSGLKSTAAAKPRSARTRPRRRSVRVSMSSTVPSSCVRASVRPSGLSASSTGYRSPSSVANGRPASNGRMSRRSPARSHTIARLSAPRCRACDRRKRRPVPRCRLVWPAKVSRSSPRSTSQAITLPSAPELTSVRPSGVKLMNSTDAS